MGWPESVTVYRLLTDLGSLIGGIFALLAGAAAYLIGHRQAKATKEAANKQIAASKSSLQAQTMLNLMDKFDSETFKEKRQMAARACLSKLEGKKLGNEVTQILDFFEDVAFLVKRGALDIEMMWHFYYWVRMYVQASEQEITINANNHPAILHSLRWAYPRLIELEKSGNSDTQTEKLDETELRAQLEGEIFQTLPPDRATKIHHLTGPASARPD
jgi:hypothetical protein